MLIPSPPSSLPPRDLFVLGLLSVALVGRPRAQIGELRADALARLGHRPPDDDASGDDDEYYGTPFAAADCFFCRNRCCLDPF